MTLPSFKIVGLILVVLLQGGSLEATDANAKANANTSSEASKNDISDERITGKPLRYRRQRILQVEDSPIFKTNVLSFIEQPSKNLERHQNKRRDSSDRSSSIRNTIDVDMWSRLLQSDMSMSMPTPTTVTDEPVATPTSTPLAATTSTPVATETDEPTTEAPSVMGTDEPTKTPTEPSECDTLNRTNAIRTLLEDITELPEGDAPFDSPQGMAYDWITNVDTATDPCTDAASTVTRFALATLYYSSNGENWTDSTNWISSTASQCTWYGITCNDNGDVETLQLCKCPY